MCMDCKHHSDNLSKCNCTYEPCSRKGNCCECVSYHKGLDQLPACFFDAATEATYDRGIDNFIKMHNKKRGK